MRFFSIGWLMAVCAGLAAEVVEYRHGDTISVPLVVNTTTTTEHIRTLILVGPQKLTIKGTWRNEDLDVILAGNTVRLALRTGEIKEIPVGVLGDNGVYYHIVVKPVDQSVELDPVINVIAAGPGGTDAKRDNGDLAQRSGGHWEHTTNAVIRLQKHIRGGRVIPEVMGQPRFNQDALQEQGVRVPGRRWTENDDWRVLEYYTWTLGTVSAHYIGVTYRGREGEKFFDYTKQRTDATIAIWAQPQPDEHQLYNRKYPGITLKAHVEMFFIIYTEVAP